jgi:hypothetical protein
MRIEPFVHEKVVNHLASLSRESIAHRERMAEELTSIPEDVVMELLAELDRGGWHYEDRLALLELLSYDRRLAVRRRVAGLLLTEPHTVPPEWALSVLSRLIEPAVA